MDDVVELNLSRAVSVTDTAHIRSAIADRIAAGAGSARSVELVRFHVFIHCTRGEGSHMVDFHDHELTPGSAIWVRPGQVQRWSETGNDFDADVLVFGSSSIPELPLFDHLIDTAAIVHLGDDVDRLQQLMAWIAKDLEVNEDYSVAAAGAGVALRLFARHVEGNGEGEIDTPGRRLAGAFIESIDRHIDQRSVSWHARQVGASTRSVARAAAEALGQRPKEVIDARVILEARRRLAWSDDDIATIARALGFSEASNFTKFFRTRAGTSPSAFREAVVAD